MVSEHIQPGLGTRGVAVEAPARAGEAGQLRVLVEGRLPSLAVPIIGARRFALEAGPVPWRLGGHQWDARGAGGGAPV